MPQYLIIFLFSLLFSFASCHNRLVSPTPWSPSPTKGPPCGGGVSLTAPQAYWYADSNVSIVWNVVGDGFGPVNISIDPTGGTNFNEQLLVSTVDTVLGLNTFYFIAPDLNCTGVNDTCSIQIFSSDGWVECTSVSILPPCYANCTPEAPPSPTCQVATGLNFCSQYNNTKVQIGAGFSAAALDLMVNQSLAQYSYNMSTFLVNGTTADCQRIFKEYLCATVFPSCDGSAQTCVNTCNDFKKACGLEASHDGLYDCSTLAKCPSNRNEYIIIFTGVAIVVVIVIAFILNFIVRKRYQSGYTAIQ